MDMFVQAAEEDLKGGAFFWTGLWKLVQFFRGSLWTLVATFVYLSFLSILALHPSPPSSLVSLLLIH